MDYATKAALQNLNNKIDKMGKQIQEIYDQIVSPVIVDCPSCKKSFPLINGETYSFEKNSVICPTCGTYFLLERETPDANTGTIPNGNEAHKTATDNSKGNGP